MNWIVKADKFISRVLMAISLVCITGLFVLILSNIFLRVFRIGGLMNWYAEVIEIFFAWMVMCVASILCRNKSHFVVDLLFNKFGNKRWYYGLRVFATLIPVIFFSVLFFYGVKLFQGGVQSLPILQIQRKWAYLCIPLNAFFLCAYSLRDLVEAVIFAFGFKPIAKVERKSID